MSYGKVGMLFFLAALIPTVVCQNQCSSANIETCGQCISMSGCAWCSQESFVENRCQPISNFSSACEPMNIENPSSSVTGLNFHQDKLNPINLASADLSLRVGEPISFEVQVTPQRNLPLDLYILIDLSGSMGPALATVQSVSTLIVSNIESVTRNVRVGLGAFNDKVVRPFFDVNVCEDNAASCKPTDDSAFAFRHVISLTSNTTLFSSAVNILNTTENADPPENGLEGLAQVIACEQEIGWRQDENGSSTKVVLFMTDNVYHYAGEGRLAGIVRPYTGECLLQYNPKTDYMEYTGYDKYDYPSIGQILDQMDSSDVHVIFAIQKIFEKQDFTVVYENLMKLLNTNSRRSSVDVFSPGENATVNELQVLNLINRQYMRLLQEVSLAVNDEPRDIQITFAPLCPENSTITEVNSCTGVAFETPVRFNVTVSLKKCDPADHGAVRMQRINSPSFGTFLIRYTIICDCGCSNESVFDPALCSGMGSKSCGVCVCMEGKCGANCNRTRDDRATLCPTAGIDDEMCSGDANGVCTSCGCQCINTEEGVISGDACQCNNFQCPDSKGANGKTCSGRGLCCSGSCACYYVNATTNIIDADPLVELDPDDRYRGNGSNLEYCQCDSVNQACRQFPGAPICSNKGNCGCTSCMCNPMYQGHFCELPANDSCGFEMDLDCILGCRQAVDKEEDIPDICNCNPTRLVLYINKAEVEGLNSVATRQYYETVANMRLDGSYQFMRDCTALDKDKCEVDYVILANVTHTAIVAIRQKDCSGVTGPILRIPTWALAVILLGCLLIIGILILIFIKIIITILDYRELKKWEREARQADFSKNQNPLYQSPEMKYENVAYGRE